MKNNRNVHVCVLAALAAFVFGGAALAQAIDPGCGDAGGGAQDIFATQWGFVGEEPAILVTYCAAVDAATTYTAYFDWLPPSSLNNPDCDPTEDATISYENGVVSGPGTVQLLTNFVAGDTLLFILDREAVGLPYTGPINLWSQTFLGGTFQDRDPERDTNDGCDEPQSDDEVFQLVLFCNDRVIWNDTGDHFAASEGAIGVPLTSLGGSLTGDVAWIGKGGADATGCLGDGPYGESVAGKIALIQRGICTFSEKLNRAAAEGAIAAIVFNNVGDNLVGMGGTPVPIPGVFIGQTDGATLAAAREADQPVDATLFVCLGGACCDNGPGTESTCRNWNNILCAEDRGGGLFLGEGTLCSDVPLECTVLAVTFDAVSVVATPAGVEIEWTTVNEIDTVGFRILREVGGRRTKSLDVVSPFIPSAGTGIDGASYGFLDTARQATKAVHYYIEDIDLNGRVTRHGPFEVQHPDRVREKRGQRLASVEK